MYHQPAALPGLGGAYLYQWNDDRCNMKHNFICKYQQGTVSQSASPSAQQTSRQHVLFLSERHPVTEHGDAPGGPGTGEQEPPSATQLIL